MEQANQYQQAPMATSPPPQQVAVPAQQTSQDQQTPSPAADLDFQQQDRPLRLWRLGIRIFAAVFVALSIILFVVRGAKAMSDCNDEDDDYDYDYGYSYYSGCSGYYDPWYAYDFISLPLLGIAMVWNIAEFITFCVNKRGAHPGVHVAMDLIAWGSLISAGVIAVIAFGYLGGRSYDDKLGTTAGSLELIAAVLHFILFVMACVACHRRRMLSKKYLLTLHAQVAAQQSRFSNGYPPPPPGMAYVLAPSAPPTQPQQYQQQPQQYQQQQQEHQQQPQQYQQPQEHQQQPHQQQPQMATYL